MLRPIIHLLRLDKPIGIRLLFFPAAWAVALAAPIHHIPYFLLVMLVGAIVTRSAGCILNDLTDRKLDAQVERTRSRPLASGAISVWVAVVLLLILLSIALIIALSLPRSVFFLALIALPMIAAYPWMKRITWWPQLFLGFTFNLGALFGWLATGQSLTPTAILLYIGCIFWTLGYDTIYAVQDMEDDARVGIRSTARLFGRRIRPCVAACYSLMILCFICAGWEAGRGLFYLLGVAAASLHAYWQLRHWPTDSANAGAIFKSNQWLGYMMLFGILLDRFI